MMDIINPWGALRRANAYIAELEADIKYFEGEAEDDYTTYVELRKKIDAAEALIAQGHFRNPETGRIGPKGKTFQ